MYIGGVHPELSRVRFEQFPLRPVAMTATLRHGDRIYGAHAKKPYRVFVSGVVIHGGYSGVSDGLMKFVEAAYKLKVIPKEAYDAALTEVNNQKRSAAKHVHVEEIRRHAAKLGLTLTKDQQAALDRYIPRTVADQQ